MQVIESQTAAGRLEEKKQHTHTVKLHCTLRTTKQKERENERGRFLPGCCFGTKIDAVVPSPRRGMSAVSDSIHGSL